MMLPGLHVVVTDSEAARPDFPRIAGEMLSACGPALALHLRLRRRAVRELLGFAEGLSQAAADGGGWCVVNERVDVALVARAQGVQLGSGALPVAAARRILGRGVAIGASVHSAPEARELALAGADYLVVGTIYASETHPGEPTGGLSLIRSCRAAGPPIIAIGGMTEETVPEAMEAGAQGVAVIGAVWRNTDPVSAAGRISEIVVSVRADG